MHAKGVMKVKIAGDVDLDICQDMAVSLLLRQSLNRQTNLEGLNLTVPEAKEIAGMLCSVMLLQTDCSAMPMEIVSAPLHGSLNGTVYRKLA